MTVLVHLSTIYNIRNREALASWLVTWRGSKRSRVQFQGNKFNLDWDGAREW